MLRVETFHGTSLQEWGVGSAEGGQKIAMILHQIFMMINYPDLISNVYWAVLTGWLTRAHFPI